MRLLAAAVPINLPDSLVALVNAVGAPCAATKSELRAPAPRRSSC